MKKLLAVTTFSGLLALGFTAQAQPYIYMPTNVAGAGLSYIVPDMPVWYHVNNYVTNGPVKLSEQVGNNNGWFYYGSVLGDSTFLIQTMTFADDGLASTKDVQNQLGVPVAQWGSQRFALTFVPADGSAPKFGNCFYDDYGRPFTNAISSRVDGNPGRVAGDKRYGARNLTAGGEAAPQGQPAYFNSDYRFDATNLLYSMGDLTPNSGSATRFSVVQNFSLDPSTLTQTPLCNAYDSLFGRCGTCKATARANQQMGRFGGDMACLSDGNFVIIANDKSGWLGGTTSGNNTLALIVRPDGSIVKDTWLVGAHEAWVGVVAYRGGFCVRVGNFTPAEAPALGALVPPNAGDALLFFYDNSGTPIATNSMRASSGIFWANATGRGDGTGFAADIRSHYVYYTEKQFNNNGDAYVGIWDGRTGVFVTSAVWSETDPSVHSLDRFGIAVDALDRFTVVCDMKPDQSLFKAWQAVARVGSFDGTNVSWITPTFFPFVNHEWDTNSLKNIETSWTPTVMMTTKAICFVNQGWINSSNNPAAGPDTWSWNASPFNPGANNLPDTGNADRTMVYTVVTHPQPVDPPRPQIAIAKSGNNVTISWPAEAGFFRLQASATLQPNSWADVSPQPPFQYSPNAANAVTYSLTTTPSGGNVFYRLVR